MYLFSVLTNFCCFSRLKKKKMENSELIFVNSAKFCLIEMEDEKREERKNVEFKLHPNHTQN